VLAHGACCKRSPKGENNPEALAGLADRRLRATPAQLSDALGACTELHPVYRRLIKMMLGEWKVIEEHTAELNQELATLLRPHQDAVERLAEVPGLGVDSAQQILAELTYSLHCCDKKNIRPDYARVSGRPGPIIPSGRVRCSLQITVMSAPKVAASIEVTRSR
jgi:hypothetical protein